MPRSYSNAKAAAGGSGGIGNVVGPASATSGHLAVFSGTTGKIIADGGAVPDPASVLAQTITNGDTTHAPSGDAVFDALALGLLKANNLSDVADPAAARTNLVIGYDLACQVTGKPDASAVVLKFVAPRAFTLLASGQQGKAGTGATAEADFIVAVGGVTKATLRFAAAGTAISIVGGTAATIAAGDIVTITAPAQDATLADIGFTLAGTLL